MVAHNISTLDDSSQVGAAPTSCNAKVMIWDLGGVQTQVYSSNKPVWARSEGILEQRAVLWSGCWKSGVLMCLTAVWTFDLFCLFPLFIIPRDSTSMTHYSLVIFRWLNWWVMLHWVLTNPLLLYIHVRTCSSSLPLLRHIPSRLVLVCLLVLSTSNTGIWFDICGEESTLSLWSPSRWDSVIT